MSGCFLSLDGIDGVGKSTQCRLLAEALAQRGREVLTCRDPGGTALGERIRQILLDPQTGAVDRCAEMLLYMASRAQLTAEVIRPALAQGQVVVSDRFLLANVVYQGYGGGLDVETLWRVGAVATGGLTPDLTIVFDLDPRLARSRKQGEADRMECESGEFFRRVRDGFLAEAGRRPQQIRVVSADADVETVHRRVMEIVSPLLAGAVQSSRSFSE